MDSGHSNARFYCLTIAFVGSALALSLLRPGSNDADDALLFMTWATFVTWFVELVGRPLLRYWMQESRKRDSG